MAETRPLFMSLSCLASSLKKGEKSDIWLWPLYRVQLPVRCGDKDGLLDRNRMAKGHRKLQIKNSSCHTHTENYPSFLRSHPSGQNCIMVNGQWLTPTEFEHFAGKQRCSKWKLTIKCMNTPLRELIEVYSLSLVCVWGIYTCVCVCV